MELMTVITMLALLELVYFGAKVGAARGKYDIKAPATTGNEIFERHYRVHYNTIEQLMLFLPGLWAFGYYVGQYWAAGIGVVYLVGRLIYGAMYVKDPESRGIGTLFSVIPCWILIRGWSDRRGCPVPVDLKSGGTYFLEYSRAQCWLPIQEP